MPTTPESALRTAIVRLAKEAESADELLAIATAYEKLVAPGGVAPDHSIHCTDSSTMLDSNFWEDGGRRAGFRSGGSHATVTFTKREYDGT